MSGPVLKRLELKGLKLAPSQEWGGLRLVPVLREQVREELRIARRVYGDDGTLVSLEGGLEEPGLKYFSYIPHGLVVSWEGQHTQAVAGTRLQGPEGKGLKLGPFKLRLLHRMVKREGKARLRLLPLHLAMEGFLALHFGGPEIAWSEYSRQALSRGLDPRIESAVPGWANAAFDEALRIFEIHDKQVGVLIFHAEVFLSAFIVSHPEDYRALHRSLLEDFYGEVLLQYGFFGDAPQWRVRLDEKSVGTLEGLKRAVERARQEWGEVHGYMAGGLLEAELLASSVYRAGPFHLQRFMTSLVPGEENHLGEAMTREDGTLEYLKTFRLSEAQTRRAYLLKQLAAAAWHLETAAEALKTTKDELVVRLSRAGFGYLLKEHVLREAQARQARR